MSSGLQLLAFDVYGTLLDTGSISADIRNLLGLDEEKATQLSLLWRRYQLECVVPYLATVHRLLSQNVRETGIRVPSVDLGRGQSQFPLYSGASLSEF